MGRKYSDDYPGRRRHSKDEKFRGRQNSIEKNPFESAQT
jgi:hypothetical protein